MLNQKANILAIIPARRDSKGLPKKNILNCAGKPLIAWTIEAALKAKFIDKVLVSTDCKEIASIAEKYGAWVPFIRPEELATDNASTVDVVKHVITWIKNNNQQLYTIIVLLQPTSPLRDAHDMEHVGCVGCSLWRAVAVAVRVSVEHGFLSGNRARDHRHT